MTVAASLVPAQKPAKYQRTIILLRLTTTLLIATSAAALHAQEPAKPAAEEAKPLTKTQISEELNADYADLDADKDGKVTATEINSRLVKSAEAKLEEYRKARDETFAKLDVNKDGTISRAEFDEKAPLPKIKEPDATPFLAQFDANKDGAVSQDEFRSLTLANFDKLDANKDGTLSVAEQKGPAPAAAAKKKTTVKSTPAISR